MADAEVAPQVVRHHQVRTARRETSATVRQADTRQAACRAWRPRSRAPPGPCRAQAAAAHQAGAASQGRSRPRTCRTVAALIRGQVTRHPAEGGAALAPRTCVLAPCGAPGSCVPLATARQPRRSRTPGSAPLPHVRALMRQRPRARMRDPGQTAAVGAPLSQAPRVPC